MHDSAVGCHADHPQCSGNGRLLQNESVLVVRTQINIITSGGEIPTWPQLYFCNTDPGKQYFLQHGGQHEATRYCSTSNGMVTSWEEAAVFRFPPGWMHKVSALRQCFKSLCLSSTMHKGGRQWFNAHLLVFSIFQQQDACAQLAGCQLPSSAADCFLPYASFLTQGNGSHFSCGMSKLYSLT